MQLWGGGTHIQAKPNLDVVQKRGHFPPGWPPLLLLGNHDEVAFLSASRVGRGEIKGGAGECQLALLFPGALGETINKM